MKLSINIRGLETAIARNQARQDALTGSRLLSVGVRAGLRKEVEARRLLSRRQIANRSTTGRLAASINSIVTELPDGFRVDTGTNLKYAGVQQDGGQIKPTGGLKLLAIPANKQIARSGLWPRDFEPGALRFIPVKDKPKLKGLLVRAASTDEDVESARRGRLKKLRDQGYKDRRKLRRITHSTQVSDLHNRAAARRERRRARKGEKGEVLFKLVTDVTIPRRPFLFWDQEDASRITHELAQIVVNP